MQMLYEKISEIIESGKADRVFAWKTGLFPYEAEPAMFDGAFERVIYNSFCETNICKYMIEESKNGGRTLVLMKPCDSRGLALLKREHRIKRENIYALGVPCRGKINIEKIKKLGIRSIEDIEINGDGVAVKTPQGIVSLKKQEVLFDKCLSCRSKEHEDCDEVFSPDLSEDTAADGRFDGVEKIEKMKPDERFAFWRAQLSKCIRCNACRNVCPACSCVKCVFDNPSSGVESKANSDAFEENLYHIVRSFHVCGRCTECGECERVCPEKIPLMLLNRKYIKDISELYGEEDGPALLTYKKDDCEPSAVYERRNGNV